MLITDEWGIWKFGVIKICFRRLNEKEVLKTQRDEEFVFPMADGSAKLSGRDYEFQEPTLRRESIVRGRISAENLMAIGMSFKLKKQKMTKESIRIVVLTQKLGKTSIVIILIREVHLHVPRKESYPIPLSNVDAISASYAYLESKKRNLSASWIGFHKINVIERNPFGRV